MAESPTNTDDIAQIRTARPKSDSLTRNLPCTLGLFYKATLSLLATDEDLHYKLELAHDVLNSREAEAHFVKSLLAEARAAVGCRQAEVKLAAFREIEAQRRVEYYCRLNEVATKNLTDAEMQVGVLRLENRKAGATSEELSHVSHRVKDMGDDNVDFSVQLD
ncbi:hypothetical protein B0H17DRAFT_1135312 [Mycena rosella]|uniref:Uncharacterized protein n=1 Tax=Mycena rosella TaxID=1033263 RepID=A0AAD7GI38_MYCRO|nr:hypothetical protein B0H17DRAFT_1135312 [Mycena rosella]